MAFSFVLLVFTYYPIVKVYLFPQHVVQRFQPNSFSIEIPKIGVSAPIISSIDPFNEREYRGALKKGIAHAKGTRLPGEQGVSFLFAHSSDLPWRMSRYNTVFLRLGELANGDTITIRREGLAYTYKVVDKKTVWPREVNYLVQAQGRTKEGKTSKLILQTCTPIGTSLMRLLIFAEKV